MSKQVISPSLSIAKLLSGRIIIQILSFFTLPILTRLFLPEHFGVIQIFDSISKILIVIACLKYELSIPLARDDHEAFASLTLAGGIVLIVALLVMVVVSVGREYIAVWLKAPELGIFLWFLPFVVFAGGMTNGLGAWAAREGQFGAIAWAEVGQSLIERVLPILWGLFIGSSLNGLFIGRIIGSGIQAGMLLAFSKTRLISLIKKTPLSFSTIRMVMRRHKKFAHFTIWGAFFNNISMQLPVFFFGTYYSKTIVGYYSLGYKVIIFPMTMLRTSISKVFFPIAAKEYNDRGTLADIVSKLYTRLLQIAVFPMIAVTFFGPILFTVLFGQEWYEAGIYAQMIAVWSFMAFITVPLQVFFIVNRQEVHFFMNILTVVGTTIGLLIGVTFASPIVTIGIFVTISVGFLLGKLIWKLKLAPVSLLWAFKTIIKYIAISCGLLIPTKLLSWVMDDFRVILGSLGCTAIVYGLVLLKIDKTFQEFILKKLHKQKPPEIEG